MIILLWLYLGGEEQVVLLTADYYLLGCQYYEPGLYLQFLC
jgi:hypothetical protein